MIEVVAGIAYSAERFLVGLRPTHKPQPGVWEFPGGKVEAGETPQQAVVREWREELGVDATVCGPLLRRLPGDGFTISFYPLRIAGEPQPLEHARVDWCELSELSQLAMHNEDAEMVLWLNSLPDIAARLT